jgi:NAD+ synthase (glutamine-hydrolysing)
VLRSIPATVISPELIPGHSSASGPGQQSEEIVGPFELADFFLYYTLRFGYRPSKVAFLARRAWSDRDAGIWPELIPQERRHEYALTDIKHWLEYSFTGSSNEPVQALGDAKRPKVGSRGSLSPRGDWRAPSDSSAAVWLRELEQNVPDE